MRIVIFTDWDHWVPRVLVGALLAELPRHSDLRLVAVCVPRLPSHWRNAVEYAWSRLAGSVKWLVLGDQRYVHREPPPVNLRSLARRHGFEVLVIPNPNDPEHERQVRDRLRAQVLLSLFWKRKFDKSFLALFDQTVNYHNGSVPEYRGLRATPWSIYRGEVQSGFVFHRMNERIDGGNVVVQGAVPIRPRASAFDVEQAKTRLAASSWPEVIDALLANVPGEPQRETDKYNVVADVVGLTYIERPMSLTTTELLRRVAAFGSIRVPIGESHVWISGLGAPIVSGDLQRRPYLKLADGDWQIKTSDWHAHRLKQIGRSILCARTTAARS